ncbi:BnaC03g72810D [Brassica napus]|uniref:BnaC03g72810D protein n=1 Tax=Brassica napus TaxID=3708 RepID=A0A078JMH9_BRANA|nr:BnaC03g72810D [Brassica napus]
MEKREPSLVPEWLRSTGNGSSVGSKNHILSSSARSDSSLLLNNSKSRTKTTDVDSLGSPFLDRSCSTNSRRGSTKNAYSNFNVQRSNRDKDRSRESYVDHPWDHDTCFPFGTFLNEVQLRRSNSMSARKQDDPGFSMGFKDGRSLYNRNGMLPPPKSSERTQDVVRISSPCLSPAVSGNSGFTPGEPWTSALAEVPIVIDKSASDPVAANVATLTGQTRNMAEALLQPPRTGTPPQESSKIQRLEDRALKLIPVLPSTPKGSVLSSSDKSKTKPMARSGETGLASFRNTHLQSSFRLGNLPSNSGSQIKPDTTKKMVVLKPAVKESPSPRPTNNSLAAAASQMIAAPSALSTTSAQSTNNPRELKGSSVNMPPEKKLSLAQTQSRNAFFSALKNKTSTNISTSSCTISKELVASDPSSVERDDMVMERVEKVSETAERVNVFESTDLPDEKEAEFLKSLGWDENNTEVEALTDEEIRAFYEQHKEVKPSLMQTLPIIKEATEDATPNS